MNDETPTARPADRRRAEAAEGPGEESLSLILDNVKDIVFLLSGGAEGDFRFVFVNPSFLAATGLSEAQVVGRRVQDVIPATAHALVLSKYAEATREGRAVEWQETSVYPSGERVGDVRVTPLFDAQGRCTRLLGTVHDVTALRRAQKRSEQLLSLSAALGEAITTAQVAEVILRAALPIFQAAMGLVALLSADGSRLDCEHIVGVPPAEAERWRSFPIDAQVPLADAVRERRLVVLPWDQARRSGNPALAGERGLAGDGALVAVPLLVGERCFGGIGLICPPEQCRDEEQRRFLWTLAGQCALSLERARLYDAERRAREEAQAEIAERRRAETALRESEQGLRLALDGGGLGSWHWDSVTGAVGGPPKTRALFGLAPDAALPQGGLMSLLHPDDRRRAEEALQRAAAGGSECDAEYRVLWPDGSVHWIALRGRVHRDGQGVAMSIEGVVQDTDARKRSEETLRRSEARYRTLVDATAQIVWTNTSAGEMDGSNAAWGAFTGQTEEEYQGYGWADAVHPEDAQPTIDAWRAAVDARRPFLFEHRVRRRDGVYRTFAIRAVPVQEEDGTTREWVGIHTDVTERRNLEAARESLLAQQGAFLRDVLGSVTEGKLLLSQDAAQLPALLTPVGGAVPLTRGGGLRDLRLRAQEASLAAGHSEERRHDLVTAVSEAGMNAVLHGGGGVGQVSVGADGTVQVRVEDKGTGITMENLPRATLSRGFSTRGTLGHGLKMMLATVDRLYLLTGAEGTTVVLEQDRGGPPPAWV